MYPLIFQFGSPCESVLIAMRWVFSTFWLNGGSPYMFSYTTEEREIGNKGYLNFHPAIAVTERRKSAQSAH
jgi:hypothetical protein